MSRFVSRTSGTPEKRSSARTLPPRGGPTNSHHRSGQRVPLVLIAGLGVTSYQTAAENSLRYVFRDLRGVPPTAHCARHLPGAARCDTANRLTNSRSAITPNTIAFRSTDGYQTQAVHRLCGQPILSKIADKPILLNDTFIDAVARRLHGIVARGTTALGAKVVAKATLESAEELSAVARLFEVSSPRKGWLMTTG